MKIWPFAAFTLALMILTVGLDMMGALRGVSENVVTAGIALAIVAFAFFMSRRQPKS